MATRDKPAPGGMRGGVRRPRGPNGTWSHVLYLGMQPAQRCVECGHRAWLGAERLEACPKCGGELRETREPRQMTEGGFTTKRDAELARAKAIQRIGRGRYMPPERMTLAEYLRDRWLPAVDASGKLKRTTKQSYHRHVKYHLIGPAKKPHDIALVELRKLTLEGIRAHYRDLAEGYNAEKGDEIVKRPGLAVPSLRRVHAALHVALEYAVELGMLDHNPAARAAKDLGDGGGAKRELPAWNADELWAFLDAQEGEPLQPLWRLMALTGMRRGEALGLKWGDVDLTPRKITRHMADGSDVETVEPGRLTVRRNRVPLAGGVIDETSTKTGRVRVVDLDEDTVETLRALRRSGPVVSLDDREAYVFTDQTGAPLGPHHVSYQFRLALKRSGQRKIPLHGLRHTHITLLVAGGCAIPMIAARAGHANPNITMKVYAHCLPGAQQDALRAMARGRTEVQ